MGRLVKLSVGNDYGYYVPGRRGPYGTSLVFRGTFEDFLEWRKS